jgi:hypothetical protein
MAVLIEGMEMPKSCKECKFWSITSCIASYQGEKSCPLIKVQEPHGRLIDADALNYTMLYKENWMRGTGVEAPAVWRKDIDAAPTIIPASEECET